MASNPTGRTHGGALLLFSAIVGLVVWIITITVDPGRGLFPKWLWILVLVMMPLFLGYLTFSSMLVALFAQNREGVLRIHTRLTLLVGLGLGALVWWRRELQEMLFWAGVVIGPWLFLLLLWRWKIHRFG